MAIVARVLARCHIADHKDPVENRMNRAVGQKAVKQPAIDAPRSAKAEQNVFLLRRGPALQLSHDLVGILAFLRERRLGEAGSRDKSRRKRNPQDRCMDGSSHKDTHRKEMLK